MAKLSPTSTAETPPKPPAIKDLIESVADTWPSSAFVLFHLVSKLILRSASVGTNHSRNRWMRGRRPRAGNFTGGRVDADVGPSAGCILQKITCAWAESCP